MQKASISQTFPRLTVFTEENFLGRSRIITGNVGIVNTDDIESLRFFSTSANATLILYTRPNFQGTFRILRGNRNIPDLEDLITGNDVESLVSSNIRLTVEQAREIKRTRTLPAGFRRILR